MFESTREQDAVAENLAEKYGRCRVEGRENGYALMVGMTEDVEMEYAYVSPDGKTVPAEHERQRRQALPRIVTQPPKQPLGFKVIRDGKVRPCADLQEVARTLQHCLMADKAFRVRACVSLTRDRPLTPGETRQLLALAAPKAVEA